MSRFMQKIDVGHGPTTGTPFAIAPQETVVAHFQSGVQVIANTEMTGTGNTYCLVDGTTGYNWLVDVTDRRLIIWSPMTKGAIGGPKVRDGQVTGGYVDWADARRVLVTTSSIPGRSVINVPCPSDGRVDHFNLHASSETVQALLTAFAPGLKAMAASKQPTAAIPAAHTIDNFIDAVIEKLPFDPGMQLFLEGSWRGTPVVLSNKLGFDVNIQLTDLAGYHELGFCKHISIDDE